MKSVFAAITRLSLRFACAFTLAFMLVVSALGVVAITQLKQELLPSIEFPQTVILAQVSGLTSEQALTVLTARLETALGEVEPIVNVESTTTGAIGSVLVARNNFGYNQERLQAQINEALDSVWLPLRRIEPAEGQNPQEFAASLLADVTPEMLLYLQERDDNFLFQLSPDVWSALSDETVQAALAYLASQQEASASDKSALRNLIDQEIVPQLEALDIVASVSVSGGQALPGEESSAVPAPEGSPEATALLFQLSPEVWAVAAPKAGLDALDNSAVEALRDVEYTLPDAPPALPESWQVDHFSDASDIAEMRAATRTIAAVFNNFVEDGRIVGALGQTDDLTPEIVTQMLAIEPTMVEYFDAEQLAAMSPDVFDVLPDDFVANLDGFTRDELAAAALARSLTGEEVAAVPVDLPSAWRIQPPQLISFSFDDLPLASFSIYSTGEGVLVEQTDAASAPGEQAESGSPEAAPAVAAPARREIPEGPPLPPFFALIGTQFGAAVDTADDLIDIQLPEAMAAQFGGTTTLRAADLLNFIVLLGDPENLPPGTAASPIPIDPAQIIGSLSSDVVSFLAENDPSFLPNLQPGAFDSFNDDVLALPQIAPPLADVWDTLARQPQFADQPLNTAADLIALGDGSASTVLNTVNAEVPADFAGYEVRLFDSLTTGTARYLALQEDGFYENLNPDVLTKMSPEVLSLLPDDVLEGLGSDTAAAVAAIASGDQESAATQLAALYTSDVPEADPDAPALNEEWAAIGNFMGVELDTADDLFRFFPDAAQFINSFFDSAQGAAFAPGLLGNLSPEAVDYMAGRDAQFLDKLRIELLQLLPTDILSTLPEAVQERAVSGGEAFTPTATVTRTNGGSSLVITVFKTSGTNTVEAFHRVEDTLEEINAANDSIEVGIGFEQASFIEESIEGVAREGGLGGIFAVIVILVFLSAGLWQRSARTRVGVVMIVVFLALLAVVVGSNLGAAGGDVSLAFAQTDVVVRVLLILGVVSGLLIVLWPGKLPYPAWRSTVVVGVSIPLSILMAFALMNWLPPTVHTALEPAAELSSFLAFILRLFPASLTINIMTLSGLTVAIGRVVDDSIVVLENIFRQIQEGGDKREAIITGTRDVSVAIFAATVITVVVFLPLGLTGGIISEFFLPFGLAVTYSLLCSFIVAITVVPVLAYLFIGTNEAHTEHQEGLLERLYVPSLKWSLANGRNKFIVLLVAFISLMIGGLLFATRPTTFLPGLGEPQITISVSLPNGTKIVETNEKVIQLETFIRDNDPDHELGTVQTIIGGGGASLESLLGVGGGVSENIANITVGVEAQDELDAVTQRIRDAAESIFGEENVTVSAGSLSDQGFGGFEMVLAGPEEDLRAANQLVIDALNSVPGITNATSDLALVGAGSADAPATYIRIDGETAVSFAAELETDNTLGVTQEAIQVVSSLPDLPDTITVSQGFNSELQAEGFQSLFVAMGIAIVIVIVILMITFGSVVHWFDIILSIVVAPVGAAVFLTLTDRVLGISAMIGLLMLIGIVVTNAVVLIDRVQANLRERDMKVYDALVEAGGRRLRPILMTALATIFALMPLAIGLSRGAIIASELGTVVIGGLVSSTLLTLIVVPVMYSLLSPLHKRIAGLFGRSR